MPVRATTVRHGRRGDLKNCVLPRTLYNAFKAYGSFSQLLKTNQTCSQNRKLGEETIEAIHPDRMNKLLGKEKNSFFVTWRRVRESIHLSFGLGIDSLDKRRYPPGRLRGIRFGLARLTNDFVIVSLTRGMPGVAAWVRGLSSESQKYVRKELKLSQCRHLMRYFGSYFHCTTPTLEAFWTFENIARCLPDPPKDGSVVSQTIRDNKKRLTTKPSVPTSETVKLSLLTFLHKTFDRCFKGKRSLRRQVFRLQASESSCLERSRREGGAYAHLLEKHREKIRRINDPHMIMKNQLDLLGVEHKEYKDEKIPVYRAPYVPDYMFYENRHTPLIPTASGSSIVDPSLHLYHTAYQRKHYLSEIDSKTRHFNDLGVFNAMPSLTTWAEVIRDEYVKDRSNWVMDSKGNRCPPVELIPVGKAGYKVRVVAKTNASFIAILVPVSDQLSRIVRQHPALSGAFNSDYQKIAARLSKYLKGGFLCESDMTAATDTINQDYALVVVNYFSKLCGWSALQTQAARESVSTLMITEKVGDEKGASQEQKSSSLLKLTPTCRGTQQGFPLSFSILCILHLFACETAIQGNRQLENYVIFGDDFLAHWPKPVFHRYTRIMRDLGFIVNISKSHISRFAGVFCGELYKIKRIGHEIPRKEVPLSLSESGIRIKRTKSQRKAAKAKGLPEFFYKPKLSHKKWVTVEFGKAIVKHQPRAFLSAVFLIPGGTSQTSSQGSVVSSPASFRLGTILTNEVNRCRDVSIKKRLVAFPYRFHYKAIRALRCRGVPLRVPRSLGGAGIPGRPDANAKQRKYFAYLWRQHHNFKSALAALHRFRKRYLTAITQAQNLEKKGENPLRDPRPQDPIYLPVNDQSRPIGELEFPLTEPDRLFSPTRFMNGLQDWYTALREMSRRSNLWNLMTNPVLSRESAMVHRLVSEVSLDENGVLRSELTQDLLGKALYRLKVTDLSQRTADFNYCRRANSVLQIIGKEWRRARFYDNNLHPLSSKKIIELGKVYDSTRVSPLAARLLRAQVTLLPVSAEGIRIPRRIRRTSVGTDTGRLETTFSSHRRSRRFMRRLEGSLRT